MAEERYVVRQRADGWAAVDTQGSLLEKRFRTKVMAERQCREWKASESYLRYAVVWYCEVDAATPEQATEKARKFLAPSYRENWEPASVELVEP